MRRSYNNFWPNQLMVLLTRWNILLLLASLLGPANANFTMVIIVLVRSQTYADQRITGPAMEIAVRKVREWYPALGDFKVITWKDQWLDTCDGLEANVVNKAAQLHYEKLHTSHPISTFIGTTCTFGNKQFLDPLFYWNLPILEGSSIPSFIADRKRYPMIVGYSYTQRRAGEFFYQVVRMFGWTDVAALHDIEDPVWRAMFTAMDYLTGRADIHLEAVPFYLKSRGQWDVTRAIRQAHQSARVFLILASPHTIRDIMLSAHSLGFTKGDHTFIAGDYFKTKYYFGLPEWDVGDNQSEAREAFRSLFLVKQHVPSSADFQDFSREVQEKAWVEYKQQIPPYDEVNTHAIGFHDAILSYGQVINEALTEGADIFDGRGIVRRFTNRTFVGIRGNYTLDNENNLKGHFELWNFRERSGDFVKVVDFPETALLTEVVSDIVWATPLNTPPPNQPECWFRRNNPACRDRSTEQIIGSVVAGILAAGVIAFAVVFSHQRRQTQKFIDTDVRWWDVRQEEVAVMASSGLEDDTPASTVFRLQVVSFLAITATILTEEAVIELKKLRGIHSEKLLHIVGLCLDRKIMLTEYCSRGSLYSFVRSGTGISSTLHDWVFRFSIISDLTEGLNFLHHTWFHHHGRLKSTCCYLTFRFVLKIGDYCLQSLTPGHSVDLKRSIWAAPEVLRGSLLESGRKSADLYSFGIIMSEVCLFGDPFVLSGCPSDPAEIVKLVRELRATPLRPNLCVLNNSGPTIGQLQSLMTDCWNEIPWKRPTVAVVHRRLHRIVGTHKDGLMEELLGRAAGHAEELEKLVADRTHELHVEKQKIQSLLFQILPRSVALDLIAGRVMVPEEYESVTILFSAVQEFSVTAAACTPTQLMSIMHTLYTTIDDSISNFDVYKVETVIDQYLIASGVPVRNGTEHVSQIASCALYLRDAATSMHWPSEQRANDAEYTAQAIKLLIGFHTGRIMTGVIGTKMPRFCLFGDTINTASRMESTAEGGQIQFSQTSEAILAGSGRFLYESRGEIAVKGKGIMHTYFLNGHARMVNGIEPAAISQFVPENGKKAA